MKAGLPLLLQQWRIPPLYYYPTAPPLLTMRRPLAAASASASTRALETPSGGGGGQLTGRERRQLRQERRESSNWREEVEDRLLYKPKKRKASWTEDLNLDTLALPGPQWWIVRASRVTAQDTAERIARALVRNYPNIEFKVYFPAVPDTKKLKNGSYSTKLKPLFPGCIFLQCVLNKEIHDFIRECDGVGGFLGSKVGNTKRQINRPKPVPFDEMETIFKQVKEAQQKFDETLKEEQHEDFSNSNIVSPDAIKSPKDAKRKRRSKKGSDPSRSGLLTREVGNPLAPGARVRVLSGPFTEFTGQLKELDHKKGKATVGFVLFGKESFVELGADQVVAETT